MKTMFVVGHIIHKICYTGSYVLHPKLLKYFLEGVYLDPKCFNALPIFIKKWVSVLLFKLKLKMGS